jgi:hypothetical protein
METKCPWVEVYRSAPSEEERFPFKVILAPGPHGVCVGAFASLIDAEAFATTVRAAVASKHAALIANASLHKIDARLNMLREDFDKQEARVNARIDGIRGVLP